MSNEQYQQYPDFWRYKFRAGDYVICRCDFSYSDSCSLEKGKIYRVKEIPEQRNYDGVILEEFPNRKLPMLASRFEPANRNLMPDNRNYYHMITKGT